ncbi:hypothetical protein ACJX0J_023864 [Zea mays]
MGALTKIQPENIFSKPSFSKYNNIFDLCIMLGFWIGVPGLIFFFFFSLRLVIFFFFFLLKNINKFSKGDREIATFAPHAKAVGKKRQDDYYSNIRRTLFKNCGLEASL